MRSFTTRREISLSPRGHVISSIYDINTNEILNYFTLIFFWSERRDLLCNHGNGDLFTWEDNILTCEDMIFSRESPPGISLVFIS